MVQIFWDVAVAKKKVGFGGFVGRPEIDKVGFVGNFINDLIIWVNLVLMIAQLLVNN